MSFRVKIPFGPLTGTAMLEDWLQPLDLPLTEESFQRLPPHPAFRSEYLGGLLRLTPRPRQYHCVLPIGQVKCRRRLTVRNERVIELHRLSPTDLPSLVRLFEAAFNRTVPICQLDPVRRLECANECLSRTLKGRDGPLVRDACHVALDEQQRLCGAVLITLIPDGSLVRFDESSWAQTAPPDALAQTWGRPHLTWIFVRREMGRWGIGTALLQCALAALHAHGYQELASTILLGNDASLLWHWKAGFKLLPFVGSARRLYED